MKRTILVLVALTLCSCTTAGSFYAENTLNECEGKGKADLHVKYGDSKIDVTAKTRIGRTGQILVMLKPDNGYGDTKVKFVGKTSNDNWLDKEMTYGDGKKQAWICVDKNQAPGEYGFNVEVAGVGTIDPRVIVIPD